MRKGIIRFGAHFPLWQAVCLRGVICWLSSTQTQCENMSPELEILMGRYAQQENIHFLPDTHRFIPSYPDATATSATCPQSDTISSNSTARCFF